MGAGEFNGLYYKPGYTYRPPLKADGSSYPAQTPTSAACDPFTSGISCRDWYMYFTDYYDNGSANGNEGGGNQGYNNPNIKQWYGTGTTFDVKTQWPEIVYCNSSSGTVTNLAQCRRNGLVNSGSVTEHTGNPFRYSTARWGRGNAYSSPTSGAYPEAPAVHEFFRQSGSTTVTVGLAYPLTGAGTTVRIIPRTGTGTGTSGLDYVNSGTCTGAGSTCTATLAADKYSFTYNNGKNGQQLSYTSFDLIVNLSRSANVVTVTNAFNHGLNVGDVINMTEVTCSSSSCAFAATNVAISQVVDAKTFRYPQTGATKTGEGFYARTNLYNYPKIVRGTPFYYTIEAVESCTDTALTTCAAGTANTYPAPVRFCLDTYDANRLDTPTGKEPTNTKARCRKKYEEASGYIYPRYGQFRRTDIPASGSLTGRPLRTDCAARPTCSAAEELTNFANWFAYYRTRMLMTKTAGGLAFGPIDTRYRVGFLTIGPGNPVSTDKFLPIDKFDTVQKGKWYDLFYKQKFNSVGTPLPEALSRAGRYFAGKKDNGINKGMLDDPMQYSCQQNFTIMTTDGYWNGNPGKKLDGTTSVDNQDSDSSKVARPVWDGATDGTAQDPDGSGTTYSAKNTIADVALYYYQTDLRTSPSTGALGPGTDVGVDNVPNREDPWATNSSQKTPTAQHMITFGLGMAEGLMDWRSDYESASTGDFANVSKGALNACSWVSGTCNWPVPGDSKPANLDDLWHAAVNGRGKFFQARNTQSVQDGLNGALTSLQERSAAGAAAATSTPNITQTDRGIFKTSYTTVQWNGEIIAQLIDPNTGSVLPAVVWSAKNTLQGRVALTPTPAPSTSMTAAPPTG